MLGRKPGALGGHHVKGQHAVRQATGMGQRHLLAGAQQVSKAQATVDADQRRTACANHQPADLGGHRVQVTGLDQHGSHQGICTGLDGQAGDLGPGRAGQVRRQVDTGLDLQRLWVAALDARRAHHHASGLVAADQHHRARQAVNRIGQAQRSGLRRRHVGQVVAVGPCAQGAGLLQVPLAAGDLHREGQGCGGHEAVVLMLWLPAATPARAGPGRQVRRHGLGQKGLDGLNATVHIGG